MDVTHRAEQSHTAEAALERISALRQEIAHLDRQVLQSVRARMQIAEEIGQCKLLAGLPVRDFRAEVEVYERTRRTCDEVGLDHEIGAAVITTLIDSAVRTQHGLRTAPTQSPPRQRSVLVIGGSGRMGSWIADYATAQGHAVSIYDPNTALHVAAHTHDLESACLEADILVLATPIGETAGVLHRLVEIAPRGLVFDICSLKSPLLPALRAARDAGLRISSAHPMFAPGPTLLAGRVMVVCDCGDSEAAQAVEDLFADTALRLVRLAVDEHDRLMACVLGLSHAVNLCFASALRQSGFTPYELERVASTTYAKQVRTSREVTHENARLYYEIQRHNDFTPEVLRFLERAVAELQQAATSPSSDAFEAWMAASCDWFNSTQAAPADHTHKETPA